MVPRFRRMFGAAAALTGSVVFAAPLTAQSLPHEKYTLDNGLTVILHQDRSLPRAAVNLWYRVGARNEPPGRSGFAHLFEHLMFMGTERVPGNQFDVLMETGGGANNASTSLDRTNYFSWGPSELLPTLLWLDADRLEDMGLRMTKEKVDKQRDVVRNELRQSVENAPYAKAYEASYQLLYQPGHPYYNGVIGTHQDLEAAGVQNVRDFFATFYVPNNCSLVVAGDFDPAQIKPLVRELFGTLPRGNVAPQPRIDTPAVAGVIRRTYLDKVQLPKVAYSYHSPANFAEGDAEMDLAANVLADGNSSRLYQRLVVTEKLAAEVAAFQDSAALGSVFRVEVTALADADLAKVEKILDEELAKLADAGPTMPELDQRKNTVELGLLNSLQDIGRRADRLNTYEYFFGNPDSLQRDLDRYRHATPDTVKSWAKRVMTPNARLIQRIMPEEPARAASPRDSKPTAGAAGAYTPPNPETFELPGGTKVMVFPKRDLPLVSLSVLFSPGSALDAPGKGGLASLTAEMLGEGTQSLTSEQFAAAVQALGATFGAGADHESISVNMTVLKRNADRAFALAADAIIRPRLDPKDWDRVQKLQIENLKQADDQPRALAGKVAARLLLGDANPYGTPAGGTPESVAALTVADVKGAHERLISPTHATVLVAGEITADESRAMLSKHLGSWASSGSSLVAGRGDFAIPAQGGGAMRVFLVDRPGATQTTLHLAAPSVTYASPERVRLGLLNTILGGSFTSRLNQNLREDHGYTYGARSNFGLSPSLGVFTAATSVQAEVTGPALTEFLKELSRIRSGDISDAEATKARQTVNADMISDFGTLSGLIGAAATLTTSRLPWSTLAADLRAIGTVTASDLNGVSASAVQLDRSVLVLVGDKKIIEPQIAAVPGLPRAVEVDPSGTIK